jgi:hypothetical protein
MFGLLVSCSNSNQKGTYQPASEDLAAVEATDTAAPKSGPPPATTTQSVTQPDQMQPAPEPAPAPAPAPTSHESNSVDQAQLAAQAEAQMDAPSAAPGTAGIAGSPAVAAAKQAVTRPLANASAIPPPQAASKASVKASPASASTAPTAKATPADKFRFLIAATASPALLSKLDSPREPPHTMSLMMGDIGISNLDDTSTVNFALKSHDSDWKNESLEPRLTGEFKCSGLVDECLFWMQTGMTPAVFYKLRSPERYAVFWNEQHAMWDLRVVKRGGN